MSDYTSSVAVAASHDAKVGSNLLSPTAIDRRNMNLNQMNMQQMQQQNQHPRKKYIQDYLNADSGSSDHANSGGQMAVVHEQQQNLNNVLDLTRNSMAASSQHTSQTVQGNQHHFNHPSLIMKHI